jgi:hypothetical protein
MPARELAHVYEVTARQFILALKQSAIFNL